MENKDIKGILGQYRKQIMGNGWKVKATGFKFDQVKEAINEVVKNFKQIQQEIKKWQERQDIYNHEVWILEDFVGRIIFLFWVGIVREWRIFRHLENRGGFCEGHDEGG